MIPKIALFPQSLRSTWGFSRAWKLLQKPLTRHQGLPAASRGIHVDSAPTIPTLTSSYVHGTSTTSLLHQTVGECLLKTVERFPDREAVVFLHEGVRKTFAEFLQDVDRAAAGLLAIGLNKGDRLGMWGPNSYEWILFQFATARAGIILVAVNPAYQAQEAEYALRLVGCKAVVCPTQYKSQKYGDMLRQVCPEIDSCSPGDLRSARLPELRSVIIFGGQQPGTLQLQQDVMQAGSSQHEKQLQDLQKKLSCDDPINIQFTSGTTGAPKGATLSHFNIVNNANYIGKRVGYQWRPSPRACLQVPLYHCFGSIGGGLCMAMYGITLVFPSPGYDGKASLKAMESERCDYIYGTPTMYVDLLNQPDLAKYDLSTVKNGMIAGSPCPPELMRRLMTGMGIKNLVAAYGTTENSPVTFCCQSSDSLQRKTETVGFISDHLEAKVVNPETGQVVPLGELGELMIRGHCVMLGYWGNKAKTDECITPSGWYKTGDIASLDGYGYCRIEGRIKDLIIRGGENIYPAEVEQFLHTHPKVMEAQVVGVKDERMGEEVCACIRLVSGQECTAEEIKAFCKGQIAHFKIPRYVLFVDSYPLTVTGKIQKNKLRVVAEKLLGMDKAK